MFDLSLGETSLTLAVALLLIGPKELPGMLRGLRNAKRKSQQMLKEFSDAIMDMDDGVNLKHEADKLNQDLKKIIDLDGNLQDTYDISDIMPEIEAARRKAAREGEAEKK